MNYYNEHNIKPAEVKTNFYTLDTICLHKAVHMSTISKLMDWNLEEIKELNPIYKTAYIPKATPASCVYGPSDIISRLAGLEDSLFALEESIYFPKKPEPTPIIDTTKNRDSIIVAQINEIKHSVKAGETVKTISTKYGVTVEQIMTWNELSTAILSVGQELKIKQSELPKQNSPSQQSTNSSSNTNTQKTNTSPPQTPKTNHRTKKTTQKTNNNTTVTTKTQTKKPTDTKKYHTVKKGDTFTRIASNNGLTVQQLKKLNPGVNAGTIRAGQKLRIK
jgi:membrane-bound lytic murein transglycosylase D